MDRGCWGPDSFFEERRVGGATPMKQTFLSATDRAKKLDSSSYFTGETIFITYPLW